jgi:hypothetical protein
MRRIRRPSHGTVIAYLALFIALGGTAMAAVVVSDNSQVAPNTISGHKPPSGKHANLIAGSVNGGDIADGSLAGADISASALPKGRTITSACNPNSSTFVDCGTLTVNLPRAGLRILVVASANWYSREPPGGALPGAGVYAYTSGTCRIGVNGAPFGGDAFPGEAQDVTNSVSTQAVTLTTVTDPNLGAGNHTIGLACDELQGDIAFNPTNVSAVVLGPG